MAESIRDYIDTSFKAMGTDILKSIGSWLLNMSAFICDLACAWIVIYCCVTALKIMMGMEVEKDKSIDKVTYAAVAYFLVRVLSRVLPLLA